MDEYTEVSPPKAGQPVYLLNDEGLVSKTVVFVASAITHRLGNTWWVKDHRAETLIITPYKETSHEVSWREVRLLKGDEQPKIMPEPLYVIKKRKKKG